MGRAMIKIRYRDSNELSPGLHAAAERHGRTTTVYLLSGLSAAERRAALRRLRLSARMGYCPRLPAAQLALALLIDRIRTTIGQAGAVFRLHPAGSTVPVMVISGGAIAFLVLSTVSIRVLHPERTSIASSAAGTSPVASAAGIPIAGTSRGRSAGLGGPGQGADNAQLDQPGSDPQGGSSLAGPPTQAGAAGTGQGSNQGNSGGTSGGSSGSGTTGTGTTSTGTTSTGTTSTGTTGSGTAGGTTLSGGADPTPASTALQGGVSTQPAAVTATAAAAPSSAAANPAPSSSSGSGSGSGSGGSGGGVCVDVGPLGICLDV